MLQFLRKYQKYFFLIITVVIISSFVFFGTYQAFAPGPKVSDETAFVALDGKEIKRSYLQHMTRFLSEESYGEAVGGKALRTHFLNDGVITKDILEPKMGFHIFAACGEKGRADLLRNQEREKNYAPYIHPGAAFLSQETLWNLFAPDIIEKLAALKQCHDPLSEEAFAARTELFTAEKRFPGQMSSQVLRYQEREYNLPYDQRLYREELSLFGYKNLNDWFGPHFVEASAAFIIESAAYAKTLGYKVTKEEVRSDLLSKCAKTFQALCKEENCPFQSPEALLAAYLSHTGMTEETLFRMWHDVLVSRRLFSDVGSAALLDTLPMQQYFRKAHEYATIELVTLSPEYQLRSVDDLKAFETYLAAVYPKNQDPLILPDETDTISAIEKRKPELVGRRCKIEVAKVALHTLTGKVTLKETWDWEVADSNWEKVKAKFPVLGLKEAATASDRATLIDTLSDKERAEVDAWAGISIVQSHPEWVAEGLAEARFEEKAFFVQDELNLEGLRKGKELLERLRKEKIVESYSEDGENYYTLRLKEESVDKEVLSFAEARKMGFIDNKEIDCTQVLGALREQAKKLGLDEKEEMLPAYRFIAFLQAHPEGTKQWKVVKKEQTLSLAEPSLVPLAGALALESGQVAGVSADGEVGAFYYRLIDKKVEALLPIKPLIEAEEMLASEIKYHFMESVLEKIQAKGGFVFKEREDV